MFKKKKESFPLSLYSRLCLHVTSSRTFLATLFKYHTAPLHSLTQSCFFNLLFLLKILSVPYVISGISIQLKSAPKKCPFSQRSDFKIQGFEIVCKLCFFLRYIYVTIPLLHPCCRCLTINEVKGGLDVRLLEFLCLSPQLLPVFKVSAATYKKLLYPVI